MAAFVDQQFRSGGPDNPLPPGVKTVSADYPVFRIVLQLEPNATAEEVASVSAAARGVAGATASTQC
jgi:hypothetical protein